MLAITVGGDRLAQQLEQFGSMALSGLSTGSSQPLSAGRVPQQLLELGFVEGVRLSGGDAEQVQQLVATAAAPPLRLFEPEPEPTPAPRPLAAAAVTAHAQGGGAATGTGVRVPPVGSARHRYRSNLEVHSFLRFIQRHLCVIQQPLRTVPCRHPTQADTSIHAHTLPAAQAFRVLSRCGCPDICWAPGSSSGTQLLWLRIPCATSSLIMQLSNATPGSGAAPAARPSDACWRARWPTPARSQRPRLRAGT